LPVGGEAQHTPGAQLVRRGGHEGRIDQAAFAMTLLVPGIGKEHQDLIEGVITNPRLQHLDGIVTDDAQVS